MVSSLAAQLAKAASINAELLSSRSVTLSYLFSSREAANHDLDAILALAQNGLAQLSAVDSGLSAIPGNLFSDSSRNTDRTLLPPDELAQLNKDLATVLRLISPYLLQSSAAKIVEWLVRRFRVHEFNQDDVLACFLPYHDSPIFFKMVTILTINPTSMWTFLHPYKTSPSPLPCSAIANEMIKRVDLARFIVSLLPSALRTSSIMAHRSLVAFSTGVFAEYITRHPRIDEGVIAFALPACIAMIESAGFPSAKDAALAGAILLAALSHRCQLTPAALKSILTSVTGACDVIGEIRAMQTVVSVLSPQEQLASLPSGVTREIIHMTSLPDIFAKVPGWSGAEKTLGALVGRLLNKKFSSSHKQNALAALAASHETPTFIIRRICIAFLGDLSLDVDEDRSYKRELVTDIYQQRHEVFQDSVNTLLESVDDPQRKSLEQLVLSAALAQFDDSGKSPTTTSLTASDALMAASSIDTSARIIGVKHIIQSLHPSTPAESGTTATEHLNLLIGLITNLSEDQSVVSTIYETAPGPFASNLLSDSGRFIADVIDVLSRNVLLKAERPLLRLHLDFFANVILTHSMAGAIVVRTIVEKLFLPLLLFSKPKQKRAALAWEVISSSPEAFEKADILKGCAEIVTGAQNAKKKLTPEEMVEVNDKVINRIAENILGSDDFEHYTNVFVKMFGGGAASGDVHSPIGLLVIRALLARLSGSHQSDLAFNVLQRISGTMDLEKVAQTVGKDLENMQQILAAADLSVVNMPHSRSTVWHLQATVLLQISGISPPTVPMHWMESTDVTEGVRSKMDMRGPSFVRLARCLYRELLSAPSLSPLVKHLHLVLFSNIGDSALMFLAGVWSAIEASAPDSHGAPDAHRTSIAALHHAGAFVSAHSPFDRHDSNEEKQRDFQLIFPSILIALQSSHRAVREAATKLLSVMSAVRKTTKQIEVYAFDAVYRESSLVQYLNTEEFDRHLLSVCSHVKSFDIDGTYVTTFYGENLNKAKGDSKKDIARKQRIMCYLLSHVVAWDDVNCRLSLLRSLRDTHWDVKLMTLHPLIGGLSAVKGQYSEEYASLLLAAYDKTSAAEIRDSSLPYWNTLLSLVKLWVSEVDANLSIAVQQAGRVFSSLDLAQKVNLCILLIESASSEEVWSVVKSILPSMVGDVAVAIPLLRRFKPIVQSDENVHAQKRLRTDGSERESSDLHCTVCLLEALVAATPSGSVDFARALLDVLQAVSYNRVQSRSDIDYVEQLLISVLESVVAAIDTPVSPVALQVDVLVRLIGLSENPQTFNQALILIGNMARFASESIIHTVMPIFTFIDNNVIHRDDEYSFKVVQQAITNIVPVMVLHFRRQQATGLDLYLDARDFLSLFTDASGHVPQHRRNRFLTHLVNTLGPDTFLAPVCMLLVDRVALKVSRQRFNDSSATLAPGLGLIKHQQPSIQLQVILEFAREAQRLMEKITSMATESRTFLSPPGEAVQGAHSRTGARVQLHALLIFIRHSWSHMHAKAVTRLTTSPHSNMIDEIIGTLLHLSTAPTQDKIRLDGIPEAAQAALAAGLTVISADKFMGAIQPVVASDDETLSITAMNLFSERIGSMSSKARSEISSVTIPIIDHSASMLHSSSSVSMLVACLQMLGAVASSATDGEARRLTKILPTLLDFENLKDVANQLLQTLSLLILKLGPRLIPHLKQVVAVCICAMDAERQLANDAITVLSSALSTMPSFWDSEFRSVINALFQVKLTAAPPLRSRIDSLVDASARSLPAATILPALIQLWDEDPPANTLHDFFDLLERSLNHATRAEVLERVRAIFTLFLEVFDLPSNSEGASAELISSIEKQSIRAFVAFVTKLSEFTFTPLFRRLQDWAWTSEDIATENLARRRTTVCRVMSSLLETFKSLMSPYVTLMLPRISELLQGYSKTEYTDSVLWSNVTSMIDQSFIVDDREAMWNDTQLGTLSKALIPQVAVFPGLPVSGGSDCLPSCLAHLASSMSREDQLKQLNLDILLHTRSEDSRVRQLALRSCVEVWTVAGSSLLSPFVTDTITFIHECAEDENDNVAKEARKLKRIIESIAGPIGDH